MVTMSFAVRKSSPAVIRPPEHRPTTTTIKLTSFDRVFVRLPFTVLLVFEHLSHDATETIRKALSQALVHYYPFAGRISSQPDGDEFSIRCSGEGAEFITASVNCSLKESKIFDDSAGAKALLDELAVLYPVGSYGSGDPLLSVQATEFSCGGLVLGATWNHAVADGAGIAQFLAAAGELARGSPSPSVAPSRWDEAVSCLLPWADPILEATLMHPAESTDMALLVPLDVTVPSALISRVKAEFRRSGDGRRPPCTAFEAVLAVLWRCRVRATMSESSPDPALITFAANMRRHVGAGEGYYGNCVADQPVAATGGAVASAAVADIVGMIRHAKDRLPDKVIKESESGGGGGGGRMVRGLRRRYDMMHVTYWRNIGFERVDFGGGAPPARVVFHAPGGLTPPVPTCVVYPPCTGKDGVNVLALAVKEEHVDAFLGELAKAAHMI